MHLATGIAGAGVVVACRVVCDRFCVMIMPGVVRMMITHVSRQGHVAMGVGSCRVGIGEQSRLERREDDERKRKGRTKQHRLREHESSDCHPVFPTTVRRQSQAGGISIFVAANENDSRWKYLPLELFSVCIVGDS